MSAGKAVNSLFLAGDIAQPTPVPAGQQITAVYFRTSTTGTRAYTNLHILMAQDTTITTLTTGTFYPGPYDTVFVGDTSLASTLGGWMKITLNKKKFAYNPAKPLIIFVGQCGYTGTGTSVYNSSLTGIRRVWSVGGCPFVAYAGGDASTVNFGIDVEPAAPPVTAPDLLYYKFENNTATTTPNCAINGVGTLYAPFAVVTLTPGGQFDTCITGTGLTSTGVTTGWNWNRGAGSWTISMWVTIPTSASGSAYYLFGDAGSGSFRCFHNGVAYPDSIIIRATGMTDMIIPQTGPAPTQVAFVYDSATYTMKGYKNGVLVKTIVQAAPLNMAAGTGFRVGGYTTSASFIGKMDEFRLYKQALSAAQILATWNQDVACGLVTGLSGNNPQIPLTYSLSQNYPNPFNPVTKISYALPKSGLVTLRVYDILGREVATLVNEVKTAGNFTVDFNASSFSSGAYFYRLESNGFVDTKKMMVIK
jgi:hypothetical protein